MGDERLPADDRGAGRHRRAARRHVRPQAASSSPAWSSSPLGSVVSGAAGDQDDADRSAGSCRGRGGADAARSRWRSSATSSRPRSSRGRWGSGPRSRRWRWRSGRSPAALLIEIDWRVIFWINLPVAALGIAITALRRARVDRPRRRHAGSTGPAWRALSVGLTAVVLALVQSRPGAPAAVVALALRRARRAARLLADRAPRRASRSSTSRSSATAPTSAPAPPPSPWSAPTGR